MDERWSRPTAAATPLSTILLREVDKVMPPLPRASTRKGMSWAFTSIAKVLAAGSYCTEVSTRVSTIREREVDKVSSPLPLASIRNGISWEPTLIAKGVIYGFLLHQGHYTYLNDPHAFGYTGARGINAQGDIVGYYPDSHGVTHGFLMHRGRYSAFSEPHVRRKYPLHNQGTGANGIGPTGDIVGSYTDSIGGGHGFLPRHGRYTTLDDSRAASGPEGTDANGIGTTGDIVGYYTNSEGVPHGFLLRHGHYTTLDDPRGAGGHLMLLASTSWRISRGPAPIAGTLTRAAWCTRDDRTD